jgi:N-acetylneuraminate synthase
MIDAVAAGGAHAAKFQSYKAEKLAAPKLSPAYWDTSKEAAESQFELFKRWDNFTKQDYHALREHCASVGVDFWCTPFDLDAVEALRNLVPAMKVASADITNIPLLRAVASTGLPVVMSVGAARLDETATALQELRRAGAGSVTLLHCVLNYPTPEGQAELSHITELRRIFGRDCGVGYSDHVPPNADGTMPALEMAALLSAVVIEKHFTDDKMAPGNDHYHAMNEADLRAFTARLAQYRALHGSGEWNLGGQAAALANARRKSIAARPIESGHRIEAADLIALRANVGLSTAHWDDVVGREAARAIGEGEPLNWADFL